MIAAIGKTITVYVHAKGRISGTVAYILPRGEVPSEEDFQKYWQPRDDIPKKHILLAKEAIAFPRVAIEYEPGAYMIIPLTNASPFFHIEEEP